MSFYSRKQILISAAGLLAASSYNKLFSQQASSKKVIIIGAGLSGLTAAKSLIKSGAEVLLIEAKKEAGGRIAVNQNFSVPVETGASFIHRVKNNPLFELLTAYGIQTTPSNYENIKIYAKDGRQANMLTLLDHASRYKEAMQAISKYSRTLTNDESLSSALAKHLNKGKRLFIDFDKDLASWVEESLFSLTAGTSTDQISLMQFFEQGKDMNGPDHFVSGGYSSLISKMTEGMSIKYEEPVKEIKQSGDIVSVITDKSTYEADFAIVTLPVAVLKKEQLIFDPPLPESKRKSIQKIGTGNLTRVIVEFEKSFLPENEFIGFIKKDKADIPLFHNLEKITEKPIVVGFAGNLSAIELEEKNIDELKELVYKQFSKSYGNKTPSITKIDVTEWNSDPYSMGAFSFTKVGSSFVDYEILASSHNRVFFAGEATAAGYSAFTHGAYMSGLREAEKIIHI